MPVSYFPVTSPASKTFEFLRAHYAIHLAICRDMFTVAFQYKFRKITARFSAGRIWHLLVGDMMLFWYSWFKYRFIKIDLVTVRKFCFNVSRELGGVVNCVNVNPSARARLNHCLRDAQNMCALTKVGKTQTAITNILLEQDLILMLNIIWMMSLWNIKIRSCTTS